MDEETLIKAECEEAIRVAWLKVKATIKFQSAKQEQDTYVSFGCGFCRGVLWATTNLIEQEGEEWKNDED